MPHIQFSIINLIINTRQLLHLMKNILNLTLFIFLSTYLNIIFSVPELHPDYHITFSCQISLGFPWLWQFLRIFLFLITLTVLRCAVKVFWRMSFYWICLMFLFMIRLGLWVLGKTTTKVKGHFHFQGYSLSLLISTLIIWVVFVKFLHLKVFFSSFPKW